MWHDMSRSVRKVASQTLGRTGRGRQVHEEILTRLQSGHTADKIEALRKINAIGIMTDRLLAAYLKCFRDEHTSVRELACRSAQCLFQQYDKLIDSLVFMVRYDPVARLKAMAIRALSLVGERLPDIRKALLWSLQFEVEPMIRTEACHCVIVLFRNPKDEELVDILQERRLLETEPIVRREITAALEQLGCGADRELPIVAKIRGDVARLGDKAMIVRKIRELEAELQLQKDKQRLLWSESDQADLERRKGEEALDEEVIDAVSVESVNGHLDEESGGVTQGGRSLEGVEKASGASFLEKLIRNEEEDSRVDNSSGPISFV